MNGIPTMADPTTAGGGTEGVRGDDMPSPEETAAMSEEAANFRNPTPPPIPVRGRYYITECEHCAWVGSSEQCGGGDEDIVCPVCCSSICGDEPSEADIAKHGEAVMQRILDAEAARDRLLVAFHDAIRRPLGVTPDSGAEFYSYRLAEEAEERRAASTSRSVLRGLFEEEAAARAEALLDARMREKAAERARLGLPPIRERF